MDTFFKKKTIKKIVIHDDSWYWPAVKQFYGNSAVVNGVGPFPLMEQETDVKDVLTLETGPPLSVLSLNQ